MNKQDLKTFIKGIVRENLETREYTQLLKEVSPPGAKAERMIQHVKSSLRDTHPNWSDDKITSVAIATAWKARNAGSVEQDECMTEKLGSPIPKGKLAQLNPDIVKKSDKGKLNLPPPKKVNEAGLTSEDDDKWIQKAVNPKHKGYCTPMTKSTCTPPRKALAKRFKKGLEEDADVKTTPLDDVVRRVVSKGIKDPAKAEYLVSQLYKHQTGFDADPDSIKTAVSKGISLKEGSYKVMPNPSYKVVPDRTSQVQKDDKSQLGPTDVPLFEENSLIQAGQKGVAYKTQGASYKVSPNPSARVQPDDKERREPGDPELTEDMSRGNTIDVQKRGDKYIATLSGTKWWEAGNLPQTAIGQLMISRGKDIGIQINILPKTNEPSVEEAAYKVQDRSLQTTNDVSQNPENVADPKVPFQP